MKIKVTEKHIREGVREDDEYCMVALALKDVGFDYVNVGEDAIIYGKTSSFKEACIVYMEEIDGIDLKFLIQDFDNGIDPEPFDTWWAYRISENPGRILRNETGDYEILVGAKWVASLNQEGGRFIQISTGVIAFNHLSAISKFQSFTNQPIEEL